MNGYELEIVFSDEQLEILYESGCKVVIGKSCNMPENKYRVAWQVFRPLGINLVSWRNEYGIYASSTRLLEGARLHQTSYSKNTAVKGREYTLLDSGVISPPGQAADTDKYYLLNSYSSKSMMTIGLCQKATINGEHTAWNAISAVPVMKNHSIAMEPTLRVSVWLESMIDSNTVFSTVRSAVVNVNFDHEEYKIRLTYDSVNGVFLIE